MLFPKNESGPTVAQMSRRSEARIRSVATCGIFASFLLILVACEAPIDSTEEGAAAVLSEDAAVAPAATVPRSQVDDCVEQTMGRAFGGEDFWKGHWDNLDQDEAQLRQWCDQYGSDDPAALAELSREWQLSLAAATNPSTVAPPSIATFADPVVASTSPATTATTITAPPPASPNVSYQNCDAVRAAGAAPILRGDPGYSSKLDRDGDGIGCE